MALKRYILGTSIFVSAVVAVTVPVARAQSESEGLTVTPFFKEIELDASTAEKSFDLFVKNTTSEEQTIIFSVADLGQLQESGGVLFLGEDKQVLERKYGLASWLRLNRKVIAIPPSDTEHISVTVTNLESLSPGGHYAAIVGKVALPNSILSDNSSNIELQTAFSSAIFVKKLGGEKHNLRVAEMLHKGNILSLPGQVDLRFHNSGNVHVVPRGIIEIVQPSGKVVSKGIINTRSLPIFPETFRVLEVGLDSLDQAFRPGVYRILVQYRYDGQEDFTVMEEPFIYVGGYTAGGILLVFILFIFSIRYFSDTKQTQKK